MTRVLSFIPEQKDVTVFIEHNVNTLHNPRPFNIFKYVI